MNIIEFHTTNFLQLFFDPTAHLQCIFQALPYIFFVKLTMWVEQLHQSRNRLANGDHITLIQVVAEFEEATKLAKLVENNSNLDFEEAAEKVTDK